MNLAIVRHCRRGARAMSKAQQFLPPDALLPRMVAPLPPILTCWETCPLRVTLISKACLVGAYQTKLEAIAAYPDVELTVVVPPSWRESRHDLRLERAHTEGYELIVTPIAFNGRFHIHFYPVLNRILRCTRPDICHIDEEPYNLATWLALRAARRVGSRSLFFTWQNLNRRYPWPFAAMERVVYDGVDAAIAGNHEAVGVLRAKGYAGSVRVIPQFGVDPALFHPAECERSPDRPFTIGYAGRWVAQKGLSVLAEAVAQVRGEWRLMLYGAGPLEGELRARFEAAGIVERVTFHPRVPSEDMPRHLGGLDALVLPSLTCLNWKEQFGRVLIEAMACGVPVVGSDSGEIPHVIGDGGLVCSEGDAAELAAALRRLMDDDSLCRGLGERGRARVISHFTQERIAAATVALYREMLDDQSAGSA